MEYFGYVKVLVKNLNDYDNGAVEIGSINIKKEYQKKGINKQLMKGTDK